MAVPAAAGRGDRRHAGPELPNGWTASAANPASVEAPAAGSGADFTWQVTAPDTRLPSTSAITAIVTYTQNGKTASNCDERIVGYRPSPPPAGTNAVSDLPFVSGPTAGGRSNATRATASSRPATGTP